jgi:Domain of unknown function (DUF4333)
MQDTHELTPAVGSKRPGATLRRYRRALVPALFLVAALVLAACGSSASTAALDTAKIEQAIARSSLAQRGQHARVSCPSRVPQEEGLKFSCTAVVGSVSTRFVVVEQDGSGRVRYAAP